jgi:hypothetical protein
MLALPPSDSLATSRSAPPRTTRRRAEPPAGPPAPTDGSCLPRPTDPPAATLLRLRDRWRNQASAPEPLVSPHLTLDRPGRHLEDLAMAYRTCPRSGWTPASARVRPPDTRLDIVSADQFLLWTPGTGWPGDGHGGPLERPVGRTSPVQGDRLPMGTDPVRTAADTSSAQRPTMRPVSRPRPTTRPARPGPDRTGRQCACSFGNPNRYRHRDLSIVTPAPVLDAGTAASLVPVRCPRGRVRRPHGRHDRTGFRTPPARSYSAGHRPLHPARHGKTGGDADGERTNGTEGVRTSSIATTTRRPARKRRAAPVGAGVCGLAPRLARRWQDCQRDRNHGSDQAAAWCRSTV